MGRISKHVLRVRDAGKLASWYNTVLGMDITESSGSWTASYPGVSTALVFKEAAAGSSKYVPSRESCYWKIGIFVSDVDLARDRIIKAGTAVSPAAQFMDVGYLCHLQDPNGFSIELLQHTFEKNFVKPTPDNSLALGQPATIGNITTRSNNIQKSLELYQDKLGMRLLSIQDIAQYGFTLYFFGFTNDVPPHDDLKSVDNREWLWQRPYTTLEIQYKPNAAVMKPMKADDGEGVECVVLEVDNIPQGLTLDGDGRMDDHDGVSLQILKK